MNTKPQNNNLVLSKVKNSLPACQCYNLCNNQAEWMIVYGKNPTDHYAYACNNHIGELISNISKGKHGTIVTFYAEHFTSKKSYDTKWNEEWMRHITNC